jgi:hypothetical protein
LRVRKGGRYAWEKGQGLRVVKGEGKRGKGLRMGKGEGLRVGKGDVTGGKKGKA